MFTKIDLITPGISHFPDDECRIFMDLLMKRIPNPSGISYREFSQKQGSEEELAYYKELAKKAMIMNVTFWYWSQVLVDQLFTFLFFFFHSLNSKMIMTMSDAHFGKDTIPLTD